MCSYLLTFAATYLKPFQEQNALADKQKNVMKVLNLLDTSKKYSNDEILELFNNNVKQLHVTESGELLESATDETSPIYFRVSNGQIQSYAIPISGYGLWSTLYGFFSIEADGNTVAGITFYAHGETPGLGAECEKPWFQNNFVGKRITNDDGEFVSITVAKSAIPLDTSAEAKKSMVDGISGATITAKGIESFLYKDLEKYEAFSKRLRNGERVSVGGMKLCL